MAYVFPTRDCRFVRPSHILTNASSDQHSIRAEANVLDTLFQGSSHPVFEPSLHIPEIRVDHLIDERSAFILGV